MSDTVKASAFAGGCTGFVGGLIRKRCPSLVRASGLTRVEGGPRNILPGMIVFSLAGAGGQAVANIASRGDRETPRPRTSWLDSKWSPLVRLTDGQYADLLEEKILRLEAEIAIADDAIAALRTPTDDSSGD